MMCATGVISGGVAEQHLLDCLIAMLFFEKMYFCGSAGFIALEDCIAPLVESDDALINLASIYQRFFSRSRRMNRFICTSRENKLQISRIVISPRHASACTQLNLPIVELNNSCLTYGAQNISNIFGSHP